MVKTLAVSFFLTCLPLQTPACMPIVSWKDTHFSTLINRLWELQTAAQGKICKVQATNLKSKQPTTQRLDLANGFFVRSLFDENLASGT